MRGFLSQKSGRARHLGASVGASLGLSVGISLCAGALIAGPLASTALAAPTIGSDENGPIVQILQPGYQDVLKGKTKILISVKTQKFNPQFVEMFIDGKPATTAPIALSAMPSAQYDWNTKLFSDGPHKLMVRVTDTQGFRGWAEVAIIINNQKKIDLAPPSLSWKNATSFDQLSGMASIELQAIDNFGVKLLMVSLKSASETDKKASVHSWLFNRPPYIVKFDTTSVPDGLYQLSAKAYDSFEQEGEAPPLTLGVVNSSVNATTVGDMLSGMARLEASNRKVSAPSKPAASAPVSTKNQAPAAKAPAATKATVVAKAATSVATKTPLLPSVPTKAPQAASAPTKPNFKASVVAKVSPTTKVERTQLAQAQTLDQSEVAAPQFSTRAASSLTRPVPAGATSESNSAASAEWRARIARAAAPAAAEKTEAPNLDSASLSALQQRATTEITAPERIASAATTVEADAKFGASRFALPEAQTRSLDGAPTWSEVQKGYAPLLTPNTPLQVEAPEMVRAGKLGVPNTLVARGETAPDKTVPQISDFAAAPQAKISAREVLKARLESVKTARVGKAAAPETRLSALPRPQKSDRSGAINAITVSPLQVNVSDALPAFHVAARSTDLRAVAARYGLPVDVLAANNGWKADKTLTAGERVNLPKQLKVAYHGVPVQSDAPSMLVGGTGVTAFRFMFEMAGGKLVWDAKKQQVVARKGDSEVVLSIGSNKAKVGDKDVMMELAAFLFEGRTMVPLRFFEDGLHAQVEWDPQTGRLVVAMAN